MNDCFEDEDFDLVEYVHDQDSDYPNSICDEERELTKEEEMICDIIYGTIGELEAATEPTTDQVTIDRMTCLKAMQLLKAYSALFELSYDDYNYDYD